MPNTHDALEIAASPRRDKVESNLEGRCHAPDPFDRQRRKLSTLDAGDRCLGRPGQVCDVFLAEATMNSDCSKHMAKLDVVHAGMVDAAAYPALNPRIGTRTPVAASSPGGLRRSRRDARLPMLRS